MKKNPDFCQVLKKTLLLLLIFSQVFKQNRLFIGKFLCLGFKIRQNTTVKYATPTKAAWNVKFLGLMAKLLAILEKMVAEILWSKPVWSILSSFNNPSTQT
jgi:hypothetical protein